MHFERPVGAAADARELEYIAALHQTDDSAGDSWMDGSIEAVDVKNFLKSRYGVVVTEKDVLDSIFADMGGGNGADECIDLTEVLAILLIPYFAKMDYTKGDKEVDVKQLQSQFEFDAYNAASELKKSMKESRDILKYVLKMILRDATEKSSTESQPLTRTLLKDIFSYYGERSLLTDDTFIDEMIQAASDGNENPQLNVDTFLKALTHDIQLYDVTNEYKFQTHYEDVFGLVTTHEKNNDKNTIMMSMVMGLSTIREKIESEMIENDDNGDDDCESFPCQSDQVSIKTKRVFTFPQIDFAAELFRSRTQYIFVWLAVISGFLFYFEIGNGFDIQVCQEENMDTTGCKIGESIVIWLVLMAEMIFVIAPCIMLLSLGNNVYRHSILEIAVGIISIAVIVVLPTITSIDWGPLNTTQYDDVPILKVIAFTVTSTIGIVLLLLQFANLVRFIIPDSKLTKSKAMTTLLRGTGVRSEFGLKQASIFKVHRLVRNAYELHQMDRINDMRLTKEAALLNFTTETKKSEKCGGLIWAWKLFLSGKLIENEGIWIHTKLLTGNIAQICVTVIVAAFVHITARFYFDETMNAIHASREPGPEIFDCLSSFEVESCYFPGVNETSAGLLMCPDILMWNSTCISNFKDARGDEYDFMCDIFEEGVKHLSPSESSSLVECPNLSIPSPNLMYSVTKDSTEESYCAAPIAFCTAPKPTNDGLLFDACVLGSSYKNPHLYQVSGDSCSNNTIMESYLASKEIYDQAIKKQNDLIYPKVWMFHLSINIALVCVVAVGIANAITTIPSIVITTLKFRSGAVPSLRDPYFKKYRQGLLATTFLLGGFIWGAVVSAIVIFIFVFVIVFLSSYQVTRPFLFSFASILIGLTVTLTIKITMSIILDKLSFTGLYRKKPLLANIASLCFECWHIALSVGYITLRLVKLLIVIMVLIGRFDTEILARGVGEIGPLKLDAFPFIFKQDLIAVDAHRHPYIERLGTMYLMKLKHGNKFVKKAGSIWRLLFVFALFPWLRQYRIFDKDNDIIEEGGEEEEHDDDISYDFEERDHSYDECKNGAVVITDTKKEKEELKAQIKALNVQIARLKQENKNLLRTSFAGGRL